MNAGTVLVLVVVLAIVALAARSVLKKKGSCGCESGSDAAASGSGCSGCSGCDGFTKVYGINVDANGMPMQSDQEHCCHCSDAK